LSRWWRAYDEAVDDPKLIMLSDKAHRAWFNLMCVASAYKGTLPEIKVIAIKLRVTPQQASAVIAELVAAELIDRREDGKFEPHNWNGRQYRTDKLDSSNAIRQKRHREKTRDEMNELRALRNRGHKALRNGVSNVTAKRPDTETDIILLSGGEDRAAGSAKKFPVSPELAAKLMKQ
jgi:hypothetical protein